MTRTVVHCLDSDTIGGCEQVVFTLLTGLDRSRWKPILFHRESEGISSFVRSLEQQNVPCFAVPAVQPRLKFARKFVAMLRQARTDVFHAHLNWPLACRHELMLARLAGIRTTVATSHLCSGLEGIRLAWLKQTIQASCIKRYIAISGAVREWLRCDLKVADSRIRVVKNGVSIRSFEQSGATSLRDTLTTDVTRPLILTTARLHEGKGLLYLLQAAKAVPEAQFVIAGDGPERHRLEAFASEAGVQDRVKFLGHREDIPQLLAACDIFVLPSLYEALGLSILEAMAAGKPVVATSISGINEAVGDGITGLLVPPRDATGLAAAIRKVIADPQLAASFAQNARKKVAHEFSAQKMVDGVTEVYEEIITSRRSPVPAGESRERFKAQLKI